MEISTKEQLKELKLAWLCGVGLEVKEFGQATVVFHCKLFYNARVKSKRFDTHNCKVVMRSK